jgi:hypothetical protein
MKTCVLFSDKCVNPWNTDGEQVEEDYVNEWDTDKPQDDPPFVNEWTTDGSWRLRSNRTVSCPYINPQCNI